MKPFDVYPLFDIEIVKGEGCYTYDAQGNKYLDLYGGHAVISIGHTHPHYVKRVTEQLNKLGLLFQLGAKQLASRIGRKAG